MILSLGDLGFYFSVPYILMFSIKVWIEIEQYLLNDLSQYPGIIPVSLPLTQDKISGL